MPVRLLVLILVLAVWFVATAAADELGVTLGFPIPTAEIGDHQLGIQGGLTASVYDTRNVGIGLDAAYHDWPVSPEFKAAFERELWILEIGSPTWNISALQTGGHVKLLVPSRSAWRSWLQLGAALYRVDPRLELSGQKLDSKWEGGASATVGFDYEANPRMRLGLNAAYHHVWLKEYLGSDFDALEVGTHLLFGRP